MVWCSRLYWSLIVLFLLAGMGLLAWSFGLITHSAFDREAVVSYVDAHRWLLAVSPFAMILIVSLALQMRAWSVWAAHILGVAGVWFGMLPLSVLWVGYPSVAVEGLSILGLGLLWCVLAVTGLVFDWLRDPQAQCESIG